MANLVKPDVAESEQEFGQDQVTRFIPIWLSKVARSLSPKRVSILYVGILVFALFAIIAPKSFLSWSTFGSILTDQAIVGIVAIGLLVPLAAGGFDLTVGAMVSLSGMIVAVLTMNGWSAALAITIAVAVTTVLGALNSCLIVGVGINSFIATLGMSSAIGALVVIISKNQQVFGLPSELTALDDMK